MSQLLPQQVRARDLRSKFFPARPANPARQEPRPAPQPVRVEPQRGPALVVPIRPETETTCLRCPWEALRPDGTHSQSYLLAVTAFVFDVPVAEIEGERRFVHITRARHSAMWLLRRFGPHTLRSTPCIGRRIGGRDHTTVIHALRRVDAILSRFGDPEHDTPMAWAELLASLKKWPDGELRGGGHLPRREARALRRVKIATMHDGGMSVAQIAFDLDLPESTVRSIIAYNRLLAG